LQIIRTIGHYAEATLAHFLSETHLSEEIREKNNSEEFIKTLLEDHETAIFYLRENIERYNNQWKDAGISDFMTGLLETHEKMAWILRSHLVK
jgi:starvation-inducible DNA-binding protein